MQKNITYESWLNDTAPNYQGAKMGWVEYILCNEYNKPKKSNDQAVCVSITHYSLYMTY